MPLCSRIMHLVYSKAISFILFYWGGGGGGKGMELGVFCLVILLLWWLLFNYLYSLT